MSGRGTADRSTPQRARIRLAAKAALLTAIIIQFVRPDHPRGTLPGDGSLTDQVPVPDSVQASLRSACYDCHSDDTRWPWYSRIAPISWMIAEDVRHGRSNLDFSRWSVNPTREPTPAQRYQWICRDIRRGIMPPRLYRLFHPKARLGQREQIVLCDWTRRELERIQRAP